MGPHGKHQLSNKKESSKSVHPVESSQAAMWKSYASYAICIVFLIHCCSVEAENSPYRWECRGGKCWKMRRDQTSKDGGLSLVVCKMTCNTYDLLWPRPTVQANLANFLSSIDINKIDVQIQTHGASDNLMLSAIERFKRNVAFSVPEGVTPNATEEVLKVHLINEDPNNSAISLAMKENYTLLVKSSAADGQVEATVTGGSFFGVRHGLETLAQLIIYDDMRNHLAIVGDVNIIDKPVYPYRGLLLDTSRHYYPIDSIKKTIDVMAVVKLNTFHWHISDSDSLPFVSERRPDLSKNGAYSFDKIYTKAAIREVVQFARERGVRVMPEFDAPAHVGEGWQDTGLIVCFKAEPWYDYCNQPPCGHLNPVRSEVYDVLEDIYRDLADAFKPDMFHMGGDEMASECWNTSSEIQLFLRQHHWLLGEKESFIKLWAYFQAKVQERAYKAFGTKLPLILWSSSLTNSINVDQYLNKDDYIIQVWHQGSHPQIPRLLKQGYRLIISNSEAYYLDCGFGAWVGSGEWCAYKNWKMIYDHSPAVIALEYRDQILGGEGALWSERIGPSNLEGRAWPRAAALAERLWAEPLSSWEDALDRMVYMQQRLVRMGIHADPIQTEWCYQNGGYCNYGYEGRDSSQVTWDNEVNDYVVAPLYIWLWHVVGVLIAFIFFLFLTAVMGLGLVYIIVSMSRRPTKENYT